MELMKLIMHRPQFLWQSSYSKIAGNYFQFAWERGSSGKRVMLLNNNKAEIYDSFKILWMLRVNSNTKHSCQVSKK